MGDSAQINGKVYHLVERLNHPNSDEITVVCADADGLRYACPESFWNDKTVTESRQLSIKNLSSAIVHQSSMPPEKIALFRSLFRGREDVYARRYFNLKTENNGYVPACRNEWVSGVCDKKAASCGRARIVTYYRLSIM